MGGCILIMAGGTGGHVFPALAVADELRSRGLSVVWLGTRRGLESSVVPKAGIEMEWVNVAGLRGKRAWDWVMAPFQVTRALMECLAVLRRHRPVAALGMGGFVAGPGGVASRLLGVPLVIHEQNAIAGLTNRLLARLSARVLQAFPGAFRESVNAATVGNPVRKNITHLAAPNVRFAERAGPLRLLVIGGSLGAQVLNEIVPQTLALIPPPYRPEVVHQTGTRNLETAQQSYAEAGVTADVVPFIEDMAQAYGWADIVVCRAGAMTISELACVGVASVMVPYPHAVDDHQTHNAEFLVRTGAADWIPQSQLTVQHLLQVFQDVGIGIHDSSPDQCIARARANLLARAQIARSLARPDAAQTVADVCREVARV